MKFDSLLAQYLYDNRKLQLQGIGTFELDSAVSTYHEHDKETYYPIEGLTFTYNTKDVTNEDLITFLVKKLGKIMPLVRSDLESYLSNIKQFLNIGKPYTIEGIGTLHKNNKGTYEFTPGNFLPIKEELNPRRDNPQPSLKPSQQSKSGGKALAVILIVIASLAVLGGIGWGIYSFFINKDQTPEYTVTDSTGETNDSDVNKPADTTNVVTTNTVRVDSLPPDSSTTYKMVIEITRLKQRAVTRTNQLQTLKINAHYDTVSTGSMVNYRIYIPKRLKVADTLRVRDSIAKFFLKKVSIAKQ